MRRVSECGVMQIWSARIDRVRKCRENSDSSRAACSLLSDFSMSQPAISLSTRERCWFLRAQRSVKLGFAPKPHLEGHGHEPSCENTESNRGNNNAGRSGRARRTGVGWSSVGADLHPTPRGGLPAALQPELQTAARDHRGRQFHPVLRQVHGRPQRMCSGHGAHIRRQHRGGSFRSTAGSARAVLQD
jgi:hypothetical protein